MIDYKEWGAVSCKIGKSTCTRCGKKDTLDNMIWSDVEMSRVCHDCANIVGVPKNDK